MSPAESAKLLGQAVAVLRDTDAFIERGAAAVAQYRIRQFLAAYQAAFNTKGREVAQQTGD